MEEVINQCNLDSLAEGIEFTDVRQINKAFRLLGKSDLSKMSTEHLKLYLEYLLKLGFEDSRTAYKVSEELSKRKKNLKGMLGYMRSNKLPYILIYSGVTICSINLNDLKTLAQKEGIDIINIEYFNK